jgi:hypothetical protein
MLEFYVIKIDYPRGKISILYMLKYCFEIHHFEKYSFRYVMPEIIFQNFGFSSEHAVLWDKVKICH